ncbi:MAG: hypothetical protein ACXWUG_12710 [Polyangiales bacterium]
MYRTAPPEQPKERACEVRVSRASPLRLLVGVWIVPLVYAVWLAGRSMWWMAPVLTIPIVVMVVVFMIPAATDRFVRIEPSRHVIELQRRIFGLKVRTERHSLAQARSVDVYRHESEDEGDTFIVHLVFEGSRQIELGEAQGGAMVQAEVEAAARTLRAYLFPPS